MLSGQSEGQNLIKELGKGLTIEVVRALDDPQSELPLYNCHIDVPHLLASVTDHEYQFCASVTAQNLAEAMRLPASALWLRARFCFCFVSCVLLSFCGVCVRVGIV